MTNKETPTSPKEQGLATIIQTISDVPIPDPLQKGLFKAANRLLGAAVDIPAAWLEAKATDLRSTSEANRALRLKTAEALVQNFPNDSPLAVRAFARHSSKLLNEQISIEDVLKIAAEDLSGSTDATQPTGEVDDDWLLAFGAEASQKTTEEMKEIFGKILAGEIKNPGSFSIRAIKTLAVIDRSTATLFRKFCSLSVSVFSDTRVAAIKGAAGQNKLQEYGFSFDTLNRLQEFGLISSEYASSMPYGQLASIPVSINYMGRKYRLLALDGVTDKKLLLPGVALTRLGHEIHKIIELEENKKYTTDLIEWFKSKHYELKLVS